MSDACGSWASTPKDLVPVGARIAARCRPGAAAGPYWPSARALRARAGRAWIAQLRPVRLRNSSESMTLSLKCGCSIRQSPLGVVDVALARPWPRMPALPSDRRMTSEFVAGTLLPYTVAWRCPWRNERLFILRVASRLTFDHPSATCTGNLRGRTSVRFRSAWPHG